ncbi:MAG: glutamyl-tRNA reductase [Caldilineaceae bacterium]|nr:glutamyl-tRNA reductase [Caldilineaceae bacterium]
MAKENTFILLVGLNHQTAPIALRERFSPADAELQLLLTQLHTIRCSAPGEDGPRPFDEIVVLSTCNRFEIYAVSSGLAEAQFADNWLRVLEFLAQAHDLPTDELVTHFYHKSNVDAVTHLLNVTAGLDSMILGEQQILGQVSRAYEQAKAAGVTGPVLSRLCMQAIRTGKRAHTETAISRHTTSISHAAVQLAHQTAGSLEQKQVLIVGSGEMARLAAQSLQRYNTQLTIVNRTPARGQELANAVGATAAPLANLPTLLCAADVVFTATSAPGIIVDAADVANVMAQRPQRPLLLVDIAVPRNVDSDVARVAGVTRLDVDDLRAVVDESYAQRQAEVPKVQTIVAQELEHLLHWLREREIIPALVALREHTRLIADEELARAKQRIANLHPEVAPEIEETMDKLVHRLVNKLLHEPTIRLKEQAVKGEAVRYTQLLNEVFG